MTLTTQHDNTLDSFTNIPLCHTVSYSTVKSRIINYADVVAVLATTEDNLQQLANGVGRSSEHFGLSLHVKKIQVMVIGRHTSSINIMCNGAHLEQVKQFIYLGAIFKEKGFTIKEVNRRVAVAKRAMGDLHMIWRDKKLSIPLKRKLVPLICPIMSYGSETLQNMINVFERLCSRRMLRISRTEHLTNEEVFNRSNTKPPSLMDSLRSDWLSWSPSKEMWHHI